MRCILVAGARPQFIKAAALLPALRARGECLFVHTGQHRDASMVQAQLKSLSMPEPDLRIDLGDQQGDARLAEMEKKMAPAFGEFDPDWVVVMGDTASTLAGARLAARLGLPLAHVEAGARSGEPDLPEERIRIEVDCLSRLLFCSTEAHARNLKGREGVSCVGDVMADLLLAHRDRIKPARAGPYGVLTLHRAAAADDPKAVQRVLDAAGEAGCPVHFPRHPRTRVDGEPAGVRICDPLPYLEFLGLVSGARFVLTDSGGLQKEAYLLGVPCITLREATEWQETIDAGWNVLAGTDPERIRAALQDPPRKKERPPLYGDGHAARRIAATVRSQPQNRTK